MRNIFFKKLIKFMTFADEADKNSKQILKAELELKSKLLTKSLKAADVYKKTIDIFHNKDDFALQKLNSLLTIVGAECLFYGEILLTAPFSNRTTSIFTTAPSTGANLCEIRSMTSYKNLSKKKYYLLVTNDGDLRFYTYADDPTLPGRAPELVIDMDSLKEAINLRVGGEDGDGESMDGALSYADTDES